MKPYAHFAVQVATPLVVLACAQHLARQGSTLSRKLVRVVIVPLGTFSRILARPPLAFPVTLGPVPTERACLPVLPVLRDLFLELRVIRVVRARMGSTWMLQEQALAWIAPRASTPTQERPSVPKIAQQVGTGILMTTAKCVQPADGQAKLAPRSYPTVLGALWESSARALEQPHHFARIARLARMQMTEECRSVHLVHEGAGTLSQEQPQHAMGSARPEKVKAQESPLTCVLIVDRVPIRSEV